MSYKNDENYPFSKIYKINWDWLKSLNLNGPCFMGPHWFCCFHHTEVSGICISWVQALTSRNWAFQQTALQTQPPVSPPLAWGAKLPAPAEVNAGRTTAIITHTRAKESKQYFQVIASCICYHCWARNKGVKVGPRPHSVQVALGFTSASGVWCAVKDPPSTQFPTLCSKRL